MSKIEPFGFFIVLALVLLGFVGNYWLRPLMDWGFAAIQLLLTPLISLLR